MKGIRAGKNRTGYLEVLVLSELEVSSRTGYELISVLGKKLGRNPSPGSIYPLLKNMSQRKLINYRSEGVKKIYFLTSKGKTLLKEKLKEKENMISKHMSLFRSMIKAHICNLHPEIDLVNRIKVSRKISDKTAKLLVELKESILESVLSDGYSINEKKLNGAISKSTKIIRSSSGRKKTVNKRSE